MADEHAKQNKALPALKRVNRHRGGEHEETDLDVTPAMSVFIVCIPFLMSMAVFSQMAVVEFSLPPAAIASAEAESPAETKTLDISVVVTPDGFQIVGTGKKLDIVPRTRGKYQFDQLRALLKAIKFEYPSQKSVVLVLDSDVLYDDIIRFMDVCRESQFPDIGLSGEIQ